MKGDEGYLERLRAVVNFAYENPNTSWYRDLCNQRGLSQCPRISNWSDIRKLPFISRSDLTSVGLLGRAFTKLDRVNEIRSTSGTSGSGPLLYFRDVLYERIAARMARDGACRKLLLWNYLVAGTNIEVDRQHGIQTVVSDPHQLDKAVRIIFDLNIHALCAAPSILLLLGDALQKQGLHLKIRFIDLQGEPCSQQTASALRELYPSAVYYSVYSMSEVGVEIGLRFPDCTVQDGDYFHVNIDDVWAESVDDELVVTRFGVPTVTPLIRYKSGDSIEWISNDRCGCGYQGPSFRLKGRNNVDFVRVAGVELRSEAIAEIVHEFRGRLDSFVSVEVRETVKGAKQIVSMDVKVVPLWFDDMQMEILEERLRDGLMRCLRVSATTLLSDLVHAGVFEPPQITFLKERPVTYKKPGIRLLTD